MTNCWLAWLKVALVECAVQPGRGTVSKCVITRETITKGLWTIARHPRGGRELDDEPEELAEETA